MKSQDVISQQIKNEEINVDTMFLCFNQSIEKKPFINEDTYIFYYSNIKNTCLISQKKSICNMGLMTIGFPLIGFTLAYESYDAYRNGNKKEGLGFLVASGIVLTGYTSIIISCRKKENKYMKLK